MSFRPSSRANPYLPERNLHKSSLSISLPWKEEQLSHHSYISLIAHLLTSLDIVFSFLLHSVVFQVVTWFRASKKRHTHHHSGNELTLHFYPIFFCKRETNEMSLLCFMSHLSMIILSHLKMKKKIRVVSLSLVLR